jgi:hypothetical protein
MVTKYSVLLEEKDEYHEVDEFICNGRFDHKDLLIGLLKDKSIRKDSVINQNKYNRKLCYQENILLGREPIVRK